MAEEQEKQKPKTTLIKHTKAESGEDRDKKKVRVVVKRKPKPKVVVRKPEDDTDAAVPPAETKKAERPAQAVDSSQPKEPAASPAETRESPSHETKAEVTAEKPAATEASDTSKKSAATQSSSTDESVPERDAADRPKESSYRPPLREDGSGRTVPGPTRRTGPLPQRQARGGRPGPGSGTGRPGASGRPATGGRPGPGSGTARPGASGRPATGGRPGPGNRPGGPGRPAGGRPSGPPRGETRRPGGAPSGESTGRTPGKKFYKSKRTGGKYDRDERLQEKEFSFNRKKPQPKANPVPKEIDIMEVVTVSELARKMNLKANELIGKLMGMGMMVTINQQIDAETAEILAAEYDCKVKIVSLYEETLIETQEDKQEDLHPRPPIVTVMGHVDHGKTKLLDAIRSTNVVDDEHGGITQHIGAYQVSVGDQKVTFLDTPGHEAFTMMRARGAQVTDIVVLVVAANDGVMPQTVEAISHAREANVPIIVAINKVDLPEANIDNVKQQLSKHELIPQDWGGSTEMVEVSALKRQGIDTLLETILLHAEVLELTANFDRNAEGKVIESRIDPGRGTVATALIERGTLSVGDSFVAGIYPGKVRAMFDDHGRRVDEATPSMPVEILGFDGVPEAGDPFQVTDDEKTARQVGSKRQELKRVEEARNVKKITLDNIFDSIQEGEIQELKVVIKGDVHGSVEALQNALERLSTGEIRLVVIHASAGAINEGDVMLASASNAIVVGFHVRPTPRAQAAAEREKVEIRKYNIIYDAVEDIRSAMEGMLAPDLKEEVIGLVEVRDTFKVPKIGVIAGSYVTEGKITRDAKVRVYRDGVQIYEGEIGSLKRFKDDAKSVDAGYECGVGIEKFNDIQIGDQIEAYLVREVAKKL